MPVSTDLRPSFLTLEDASNQGGVPLHKVLENDPYAAKNASASLIAKDSTGLLLKYLKVDSNNALLVNMDGETIPFKSPAGELNAGSATMVAVTGAEIVLATSKTFEDIGFIVSCRRDALFQIIQQDDTTDTVIGEIVVGPGMYTHSNKLHEMKITSGATGVQKLKLYAKNFEALSSLRGTLTISQVA